MFTLISSLLSLEMKPSVQALSFGEAGLENDCWTYQNVVSQHKTSVTLAIVFGILGGLILLVLGAWALMLFVFNKWIKDGDKVIRAFKLFGLKKKDGKFLVLAFPVKFVGKEDAELFNSKEEALK